MINSQSLLRGPKKRVIHLESSKPCENTKSSHYRSSPSPPPRPPSFKQPHCASSRFLSGFPANLFPPAAVSIPAAERALLTPESDASSSSSPPPASSSSSPSSAARRNNGGRNASNWRRASELRGRPPQRRTAAEPAGFKCHAHLLPVEAATPLYHHHHATPPPPPRSRLSGRRSVFLRRCGNS